MIITFPLFVAIIFFLFNQGNENVGYVDGVSIIYFISFVIVPMQKISDRSFEYSGIGNGVTYQLEYFLIVSGLALVSYIALAFFLRKSISNRGSPNFDVSVNGSVLIIIALTFALVAVFVSGSIDNLQASRGIKVYSDYGPTIDVLSALLCVNAVFSILRMDTNKVSKLLTCIFCCGCLLFVANPFNSSRFVLLGVWIPVLISIFPSILRLGIFYLATPFILLVMLPVLNLTTRLDSWEFDSDTVYGYGDSIFVISFFDLFECCCEALRYISRFGYQNGELFLFTISAYIPRSFWPDKPVNSGLLIGRMNVREGLHNENLAVPWFMDGYMDFGIVGSVLYGLVLAGAFVLIRKKLSVHVKGVDLAFLMFIANIAILVRGTLGVVMHLYIFEILGLVLYSKMFLQRQPSLRSDPSIAPPRLMEQGRR